MLKNRMAIVTRDPVGVVSKTNFPDDGPFSSSGLSPSSATNELMGFTAVNFQEPLHFSPFGPVGKDSARPPTRKSWRVKVECDSGGPPTRRVWSRAVKASQN